MRPTTRWLGTLVIAAAAAIAPLASQSASIDATVATLPTAWAPVGIAASADGRFLYVMEHDTATRDRSAEPCVASTAPAPTREQIEVFDTATRSRVAVLAGVLDGVPDGVPRSVLHDAAAAFQSEIAVDPARHLAYVARTTSPDVDVIDTSTGSLLRTMATGLTAVGGVTSIDPARRRLYLVGTGAGEVVDNRIVRQRVRMIDLVTERPAADIVLPNIGGARVDPATGRLWVLASGMHAPDAAVSHLVVFDPHTLTEAARFRVGRCASGLAFDQARQLAYVTNAGDQSISAIDMTRIPARPGALPAPADLRAIVGGTTVGFSWSSVPAAASYDLEIGSRSGATDLAVVTTTGLGVTATHPAGTAYARVRAKRPGGAASDPSNEVVVAITANTRPTIAPGRPADNPVTIRPGTTRPRAIAADARSQAGTSRLALTAIAASAESQLWEHVSTVGRWAMAAGRCVHPPTPAFPTGDYHFALVCPPDAPLQADEILSVAGLAVFDPGPGAPDRAERYRVYAADYNEGRVIAFDINGAATVISDARSFRQQYQFTSPSTGRGPASSPGFGEVPDGVAYGASGVAVDAAGNLLVAELDASRVEVFGADGAFRFNRKIGPANRVRELRPGAVGIAITRGTTVAAPAADCTTLGAGRIAVSTTFNALYTSASNSHILPQGLMFENEDLAQMHQVLVFDEKFCAVGALGQASQQGSDAPGSFRNPEGLVFDSDGRLIVADAGNGRVQVFAPAAYNDPLAPKTPVLILDDFDLAVALVLDAGGRLLVPDKSRQRITAYELAYPSDAPATATVVYSMPLSRIGESGANLAQFPTGIAIDAEGQLYVGAWFSVFGLALPRLAIDDVEASAAAVPTGGQVEISYSITVPRGKAPVAGIVPSVTVTGATLVSGPAPVPPHTQTAPVDLAEQQTVRYRSTFVVTAAASELVTFTVSAGNATVRSPFRTVDVRVVARDGETIAPGVGARLRGNQQGGVYTGPVTVTLTATDASGVSRIGWRWASGPRTASNAGDNWNTHDAVEPVAEHDVLVEGTGTTELRYWAVDAHGIKSAEHTLTLVLDVEGPSLVPIYTPDSGVRDSQGGPWWTTDVSIAVDASDTTTATADIVVSPNRAVLATAEGQVVSFTAVDEFGHRSTFSITARIDRFAPTVSAVPGAGTYTNSVTVTAQGADSASGIASLDYSLTGAQTVSRTPYSNPIDINRVGTTTLTIYARDRAGRTAQESFDYRIGP